MGTEYKILLTDKNLDYVGDEIIDWESIDITLKYNEPSNGLFVIPAYDWVVNQVLPGRRVVIIRNLGIEWGFQSSVLVAGPVEEILRERGDDGENAGVGKMTVHFADDLSKIAARLAYPNPAQAPPDQTTDRWQFTGNAEIALRNLVDGNAGPGALIARRVDKLVLGAQANVGTNVTVDAQRMQPLGELMREIAEIGGGIGFRTRQVGRQILFEVYAPPDKTKSVRFGFGLGNLKYLSRQLSAPTATAAIVGGQGEGADRLVREYVNAVDAGAWDRYETLVSRPGSRPVQELDDAGTQALADGAATERVSASVSDIPDQRFGVHYNLGDKVSIETDPGKSISDVVVTVHVQAWNGAGEYVAPTVGSQAAATDPVWVQRMREIDERLGRVERTVVPATLPA